MDSSEARSRSAACQVVSLAAHQRHRSSRAGQRRTTGRGNRRRVNVFGKHFEGHRQQRVAGQDRHAFSVNLVIRRPAAAQIIIVHGRQVVMNERIRVNHLDRTCGRHGIHSITTASLGCH